MEYFNAIKEFGFIVIACIAMGYFIKYMFDRYEKRMDEQRDAYLKTIADITDKHAAEAAEAREVTRALADSINKLSERVAAWEARDK